MLFALSAVYKAICKRTNETVVLKSYQLSSICELYQHQIFREVGLHASLEHENVVQLNAAFQVGCWCKCEDLQARVLLLWLNNTSRIGA